MKNTNEIKPLTITDGLDVFQAHALIDTLSGYKGTEAAIYAIEDWAAENAVAFAIKYANEGNADDAAALLEIYDGDGEDDDNWADVISAIDRARTAEWASRNWLEIKTRTIPVTSKENLREIERAAAISGLTVPDYGVDDDGRPTDATIMGTADDIKALDALAAHFNHAPANEEPANEPAEIEKYFDIDDEWKTIYAEVDRWRNDPANENHAAALEGNAIDAKNAPNNLYRAGVFAGLAEAAAWAIYARGICYDDINAITAAIYKAYGLPW